MSVTRVFALAAVPLFALAVNTAAAPVTYDLDKNHTEVRFCWNHFGISRQCAHFLSYEGELVYDEANPDNSKVQATFKTDSIETLVPVFNEHMRSDKLFDTKNFPEISFKSTKFERTGEKTGKVLGDLTVKGVTKPVVLDITLNYLGPHPVSKHPTIGIGAITKVKRAEFGLAYGTPFVSDEISIEIQSEMKQRGWKAAS